MPLDATQSGPRRKGREVGPSYLSVPGIPQAHPQTLATGFSPLVPLPAPHLEHGGGGRGLAKASSVLPEWHREGSLACPQPEGLEPTADDAERASSPAPCPTTTILQIRKLRRRRPHSTRRSLTTIFSSSCLRQNRGDRRGVATHTNELQGTSVPKAVHTNLL